MQLIKISYIKHWPNTIRPHTLTISLSPLVLGIVLASVIQKIDVLYALFTVLCGLFLQIFANLINDYFDYKNGTDTEQRIGHIRGLQEGTLSLDEIKKGSMFVFFMAIITGIPLILHGGLPILLLAILSILASYFYTATPFKLSYRGLGEIFAFVFFGPVAVNGAFYLQTKTLTLTSILLSLSSGLLAWGIMAINNLRDQVSDKESNKKTLPVIFGEAFGRGSCLFGIFGSLVPIIVFLIKSNRMYYLSIFLIISFIFRDSWFLLLKGRIDQRLNLCLEALGKYLTLHHLCLIICIIFPYT